jgi:hypothetical protein
VVIRLTEIRAQNYGFLEEPREWLDLPGIDHHVVVNRNNCFAQIAD